MARPRIDDSLLKSPRRPTRQTSKAQRLDVKPPTKREKDLWKPLLDMCIAAVLRNERTDNVGKKEKVRIFFPNKTKKPDKWPTGRTVEKTENGVTIEYNAELLLIWMYQHFISDYSPSMLYAGRMGYMASLTRLENDLTIDLDML